MSGQQQNIFTIQDAQFNGGNNSTSAQQLGDQSDILIDTSSIPLTQQATMPPIMQHHQHSLQPTNVNSQQQQSDNAITSQPVQSSSSSSSKVAPENQSVVYSVHPVFSLLDQHDTLLVRQRADCTSTCCGFESVNTYTVRAKDGQPMLKAIENSNCCERCCFETNREYNLSLVHGEEVVARIRKPYRVSRFCCYSNAVRIESPEDNPIGFIKQQFTLFGHSKYSIYDCQQPPKKPSFVLESNSCRFCCTPLLCTCLCGNKEFKIVCQETKEEVGIITRHWSANNFQNQNNIVSTADQQGQEQGQEMQQLEGHLNDESISPLPSSPTNRNNTDCNANRGLSQVFGIQFEPNLEARHKVLLLSACFMMDFFYFENDRRRRKLANC